jgi:hypothetical protein
MTGHGAKFHRKKEEAIVALLSHRTVEEAANAIGIATRTLLRWLQISEFRKEYLKARREVVCQGVARLQQATGAAGITILKLMTDPNVPASVRLRAAEAVFSLALKGVEVEDMDVRVTELEQAAASNTLRR